MKIPKIFTPLLNKMGLQHKTDIRAGYDGASVDRLSIDWGTTIQSPSALLRPSLRTLRARSRDLAINNDYARHFFGLLKKHIAGPEGIKLQNKAKNPDGTLDGLANDKIEENWLEFNKKGNFDVTGMLSGEDADRLFIESVAKDGEMIIRFVHGFDNPWQFSLQFLEADHLDEMLNVAKMPNGNQIRMGVEYNAWARPVAYHLLSEHPGDYIWQHMSKHYLRVPAEEVLHPFMIERSRQPRGVPWMHAAMTRLNNIGAYEEAEIVGARVGASHMGVWEANELANSDTNPGASATDSDGSPLMEVEPGTFIKAPYGYKLAQLDPSHPSGNFGPFMKSTLRGIAAGLLMTYNTLASDLEGVNFSSLRSGAIEERDMYRLIQNWMIKNYKEEVYSRWLRMALLTQQVNLPVSKISKFNKPKFVPRSWDWVDPKKDIEASILALDNLLTTRTDLAEKRGEDFEEILIKRKQENELMKKYGVEPITNKEVPSEKPEEDAEEDDDSGEEIKVGASGNGASAPDDADD